MRTAHIYSGKHIIHSVRSHCIKCSKIERLIELKLFTHTHTLYINVRVYSYALCALWPTFALSRPITPGKRHTHTHLLTHSLSAQFTAKHTLKSNVLHMQLLQFTVLLMHTSTTATLSLKSSFQHSGSHMHAIVSIISYRMHYPTGNYLIVQPKLPHSSTEEPLRSRDMVSRTEQGPERHNQSKQS